MAATTSCSNDAYNNNSNFSIFHKHHQPTHHTTKQQSLSEMTVANTLNNNSN